MLRVLWRWRSITKRWEREMYYLVTVSKGLVFASSSPFVKVSAFLWEFLRRRYFPFLHQSFPSFGAPRKWRIICFQGHRLGHGAMAVLDREII